jgi:hypothetical protein
MWFISVPDSLINPALHLTSTPDVVDDDDDDEEEKRK